MNSLIIDELSELRKLQQRLTNGTVTVEEITSRTQLYKASIDRQRLIAEIGIKLYQEDKQAAMGILSLFTGGSKELSGGYEQEEIDCPLMSGRMVERSKCLDMSGETKNIATCKTCDHYQETRNLLLPAAHQQ